MLAGGQSGSDGSVCPAFQLEGAGQAVQSDGFCRTRGPSAKRGGSYGLAPRLHMLAGGSPGQTASVRPAFQLQGVGRGRAE
jgi:hypothetical protein